VNIFLIRKVDMKDSKHIKRAPHDTEQHLLQKEQLSDSDNCLKTMKQIATLIEEGAITFLK